MVYKASQKLKTKSMKSRPRKSKKFINYRWLLLAVILAAVLITLLIRSHKKVASTIPSTNPASATSESSQTRGTSGSSASSPSPNSTPAVGTDNKSQAAAQASSGTLITPYGTFVSNHFPGQNGSGTSESSTCITTPGAQCYIQLTKGSEVKLLDTRTTDSSGTAYWNWDVKTTLGAGSWTVSAIASLNGQTKSVQDNQPLTVQP